VFFLYFLKLTLKNLSCSIEVLDETADSKATVLKTEYSSQKVSDWDKAYNENI
jgi:hypothetical protein